MGPVLVNTIGRNNGKKNGGPGYIPSVAEDFHKELRTYLLGHGITQYRIVYLDGDLNFTQEVHTGF